MDTTTATTSPTCPRCAGPLERRCGRDGPFLGCRAFPRCRGTASLPANRRAGEHPLATTRRLALAMLARCARGWSADDREDAAQEALVRAVAGGWAERPEAWTFVARHALRHLRGWQATPDGGRRSSRSAATPTAGLGMVARDEDGTARRVSPSDWLERRGALPPMEDLLDAAPRARAWCDAGVAEAGGRPLARMALRRASVDAVARATGSCPSQVYRWRAWTAVPSEGREDALRDIAAGYGAPC